LAVVAFGAALVPYNACLPDIADEAERDRVSARGFAYGYAGGGLLLAVNLAFLQFGPAALGISRNLAVRIDIASVAVWWAVFTLVSMRILGRHLPEAAARSTVRSALRHSLTDLRTSLKELFRYKQATRFLGAFILFGNGVQGVIGLAGVFIVHELFIANGQPESDGTPFVMVLVLVIQFCAVPGALLFARLADRIGTQRAIVTSLGLWIAVVTYAFALLDSKPQALGLAWPSPSCWAGRSRCPGRCSRR
jgi:UMF1 family MFS transporter